MNCALDGKLTKAWGVWWFFMGLLFGPIGLITALGLPDKNVTKRLPNPKTHVTCPECVEFVHKEAKKCAHCGTGMIPDYS